MGNVAITSLLFPKSIHQCHCALSGSFNWIVDFIWDDWLHIRIGGKPNLVGKLCLECGFADVVLDAVVVNRRFEEERAHLPARDEPQLRHDRDDRHRDAVAVRAHEDPVIQVSWRHDLDAREGQRLVKAGCERHVWRGCLTRCGSRGPGHRRDSTWIGLRPAQRSWKDSQAEERGEDDHRGLHVWV